MSSTARPLDRSARRPERAMIAAGDLALARVCEAELADAGIRVIGVAQTAEAVLRILTGSAVDYALVEHRLAESFDRVADALEGMGAPSARMILVLLLPVDDPLGTPLPARPWDGLLFGAPRPGAVVNAVRLAVFGHCSPPSALLERLTRGELRSRRLGSLTPLERRILDQLATGKANRGIAAALSISESAVKAAIRSILAKLALRNRTEAAILALRNAGADAWRRGPNGRLDS